MQECHIFQYSNPHMPLCLKSWRIQLEGKFGIGRTCFCLGK